MQRETKKKRQPVQVLSVNTSLMMAGNHVHRTPSADKAAFRLYHPRGCLAHRGNCSQGPLHNPSRVQPKADL